MSQVKVACGRWDAFRLTMVGYCAAAGLRLVPSVPRVAIVIRWWPTIAAAPIFTGEHAATAKPAPTTTADALISLRSTALSLLRDQPSKIGQPLLDQHRPDDVGAPGQQFSIPQRLTADHSSPRHRYEHRTHRG